MSDQQSGKKDGNQIQELLVHAIPAGVRHPSGWLVSKLEASDLEDP